MIKRICNMNGRGRAGLPWQSKQQTDLSAGSGFVWESGKVDSSFQVPDDFQCESLSNKYVLFPPHPLNYTWLYNLYHMLK